MLPNFPKVDRHVKTIEGVPTDNLLDHFGSPLFVISERVIKEKYHSLVAALTKYYPLSRIAYSFKTNYLPGVIKIMKNFGSSAEVVSGFEYWLAKKLGFQPKQIIFNGPDKKTEEVVSAIREGAVVNIDNQNEIDRIGETSKKLSQEMRIGIRINTKIGKIFWNRFGFNLESGEAYEVIKKMKKIFPLLTLNGLHIHISSNINETSYYSEAAERLSDFALKIQKDFRSPIEYINVGGGFAVPGSRWKDNPIWVVPDIEEYIEGIAKIFNQKFPEKKPLLLCEPGRFLIDEAVIFLTTVTNIKIANNIQMINADSSSLGLLKTVYYRKNIIDIIKKDDTREKESLTTHIGGNTCIGPDFLSWDNSLPRISVGDVLLFYNAGAYTISRTEQFIHPRPAVVIIKENGDVECIRRKEAYEDLIALDQPIDIKSSRT